MVLVYMVFRLEDKSNSTYVTSCLTPDEAEIVVTDLNRSKGPNTTFYIVGGYRYE